MSNPFVSVYLHSSRKHRTVANPPYLMQRTGTIRMFFHAPSDCPPSAWVLHLSFRTPDAAVHRYTAEQFNEKLWKFAIPVELVEQAGTLMLEVAFTWKDDPKIRLINCNRIAMAVVANPALQPSKQFSLF